MGCHNYLFVAAGELEEVEIASSARLRHAEEQDDGGGGSAQAQAQRTGDALWTDRQKWENGVGFLKGTYFQRGVGSNIATRIIGRVGSGQITINEQ